MSGQAAEPLAAFYEAGTDEVHCGWAAGEFIGCNSEATTRIEWVDGQSAACDQHAIAGRRDWQPLIARLSTSHRTGP